VCKRKARREEKYKEHETNFEGVYLRDGWADSTEIWNEIYSTPRELPQQKW